MSPAATRDPLALAYAAHRDLSARLEEAKQAGHPGVLAGRALLASLKRLEVAARAAPDQDHRTRAVLALVGALDAATEAWWAALHDPSPAKLTAEARFEAEARACEAALTAAFA